MFAATRKGRVKVDSMDKPKFLKGLTSGRVGMAWKGTIQGFLFKITIEGVLDPEWVAKQK